eukprot:jgi/Chlat1/4531/Chrsp29S04449
MSENWFYTASKMKGASLLVLAALLATLAANVEVASAHGYMAYPATRGCMSFLGWPQVPPNYCCFCNNAGGVGVVGAADQHGLCGDPYSGPQEHMSPDGQYALGIIVATFNAGDVVDIHIKITSHHMGAFEFYLCPLSDPSLQNDATQACLDQHVLNRADGKGTLWFLPAAPPASQATYYMQYNLPDGVTAQRAVLQWHYIAGNSCNQQSWLAMDTSPGSIVPNLNICDSNYVAEQFWNCADIAIQ